MFAFLLFTANKSNLSVCFLGESTARQSAFPNQRPLETLFKKVRILKTLIRFQKDFGFIVIVDIKRKYMTALQNSTRSASKAPSARLGSSLQNQFFNLTKAQGKLGLFLITNHGCFFIENKFTKFGAH